MNNIVKHSKATEISVNIHNSNKGFVLEVRDNGQGFDVPEINGNGQSPGLGLRNMKNRTEMIGGEFHINSEKGKGTLVQIYLPALEEQPTAK